MMDSVSPQQQPLTTHYSNSAEIAQKLLQGWVLMSDYCEEKGCNLPLIKNTEGTLQCVACSRPGAIVHSSQRALPDPTLPAKGVKTLVTSLYPEVMVEPQRQSPPAQHLEQSQMANFTPSKQPAASAMHVMAESRHPEHALSLSPTKHDQLRLLTLDSSDAMAPWSQIGQPTEALLMQKIGAARRQLQGCDDVDDSKKLCSLIAEAANALKAIKSLGC